jgi:hypothetical protein
MLRNNVNEHPPQVRVYFCRYRQGFESPELRSLLSRSAAHPLPRSTRYETSTGSIICIRFVSIVGGQEVASWTP